MLSHCHGITIAGRLFFWSNSCRAFCKATLHHEWHPQTRMADARLGSLHASKTVSIKVSTSSELPAESSATYGEVLPSKFRRLICPFVRAISLPARLSESLSCAQWERCRTPSVYPKKGQGHNLMEILIRTKTMHLLDMHVRVSRRRAK